MLTVSTGQHPWPGQISFARSEKSCDWDLKIKDDTGKEIEWTSLDLCAASHITLIYQNNKATAIIK